MNWLGRIFGKSDATAASGHPWFQRLEAGLAGIEKFQGVSYGAIRNILSFVADGSSPAVVNEMSAWGGLSNHLGVFRSLPDSKRGSPFYQGFEDIPADCRLRWAQVLAAGFGPRADWALEFPGGIHWPEALVLHAAGNRTASRGEIAKDGELSFAGLQEVFTAAGLDPVSLLLGVLTYPNHQRSWSFDRNAKSFASVPGFSGAIAEHSQQVRSLLQLPAASQRMHLLTMLERAERSVLATFAQELADLTTSSSKQVRAAAEPLLRRCLDDALPHLKQLAVDAKPDQRLNSLRLVWQLANARNDASLKDFALHTAGTDKASSVNALTQEWTAIAEQEVAEPNRYDYEVPVIDWSGALTPEVKKLLEAMWCEINLAVDKHNEQMRKSREEAIAKGQKPHALRVVDSYSQAALKDLCRYIENPAPRFKAHEEVTSHNHWHFASPALQRVAKSPAASPVVVLKCLAYFNLLRDHGRGLSPRAVMTLNALHAVHKRPSLLELSTMLNEMGLSGRDALFFSYCVGWGVPLARDWPAEAAWPFFAHHVDRLIDLLSPTQSKEYWFDRQGLFHAVATLPTPPNRVTNAMFDLALGSAKSERLPAQLALHKLPGKEVRIINALADGKSEVRAVAAQWLMRLRHEEAIPALEKAVAKEKHDVAKGAMLDALQSMGQPVEKYLDRTALAKEAGKSLKKGLPKDLEWFPWSALPSVHWADSGDPVSAEVLQWLLVQAVKQKSPEPNAVLRKYCSMIVPREREALGQFVLETWLAEDTRPIPPDDAMKMAQSHASQIHGWMKSHPQYYKDSPYFGKSVEEIAAASLPGFLRQPAGSAIGSKGLLAVAAACAAGAAAAPAGRFLKEYYGTRAAQGKALIGMLAWIEHPSATQLMLSVGNRFRTKSFQQEATRQAEALAERKGWTIAELADRTIPTAGFDETGVLELNYGSRVFSARLLPDFKVELFNPDGKKIAALPEPRQDDDADMAKDAKKAFSSAKKEIKSIVGLQTERLYEALCTERDWAFEDWNAYLNQHPVLHRLVQRLVWAVADTEGQVKATFRPLDDGSLTDVEDSAVTLAADARVRVAHDTNLAPEQVAQWQQHLVDYEIAPLFQQFGKGTYTLPKEKAKDTSIEDFEGYLIETFALRGRANKLGYTRGSTEDGGWFMTYEKRFPTLGLVAVIEFTGNPLPEENRTVALLNLSFASSEGSSWERAEMMLSQVPAVLVSECYNDLRIIAADGAGFDPEWRKKSEY